jgi:drug/metabolite transporter (DMT)-like permease
MRGGVSTADENAIGGRRRLLVLVAERHGWLADWILLLLVALTWGSLFILVKRGLRLFSPLELSAVRFMLCFLILVPFLPRAVRHVRRGDVWSILVVAFIGSGIPVILLTLGQQHVSSATTGVINSLSPLFTLCIGWAFFQVSITWLKALGVVSGLVGAVILVFLRADGSPELQFSYGLLMVGATVCYGWSANVIRMKLRGVPAASLTSLTFTLVGVPSAVVFFALGGRERVQAALTGVAVDLVAVPALALFAVLAVIWYSALIQRRGALFGSTVTYLMPLVSIMWGVLDGEQLGLPHAAGLALILGGVFMANVSPQTVSRGEHVEAAK